MGMAAEAGADRVITAIDKAVLSPLFGGVPIEGAKEVLVNFATASSGDLKMKEVNKALDHIQNIAAGKDENGDNIPVNIIWGTSIKPELEDKIEIIIVVTGFHADSYYHEAFGGKLGLTMESKTAAAPEPEQPTPPITIAVEQPKPAPQPVQPKPAPAPQVVEPVQPKPAPAPQVVEPKPAPKPQLQSKCCLCNGVIIDETIGFIVDLCTPDTIY